MIALALMALLTLGLARAAAALAASSQTKHAQSKVVPYVAGRNLLITIEHPFYNVNTRARYAELLSSSGNTLGFLFPVPDDATHTGQVVNSNRLTVNFNMSSMQPHDWDPKTPRVASIPVPSLGSGSMILITTTLTTDASPTDPITIEQVLIRD